MPDRPIEVAGGVDGLRPEHGPLFAVVGVFDGIHLGHRYLLRRLVDAAHTLGARPAVITFDSHPDEILVGAAPPLLLDPAERVTMLGEAGVEVIVIQHFDAALRATEYDTFLRRITSQTALAGILMTPDAAFGHDRRGTPDAVRALGEREGFALVVIPPFSIGGRSVRSSDIRSAIAAGELRLAEELLGRPYAVVGDLGADGTVRFEMPVAHPPAGAYRVLVHGQPAGLAVDNLGSMRLAPGPAEIGSRVRLAFVSA